MLMCQLAAREEDAAGQLAHFAYWHICNYHIDALAHYHIGTLAHYHISTLAH